MLNQMLNTLFIYLGVLHKDGTIDNKPSIERLTEISVAYGKAG